MPSKCFASWASPNWPRPPRRRDKNRSCSDQPQNPPPYLLGVTGHNVKHALGLKLPSFARRGGWGHAPPRRVVAELAIRRQFPRREIVLGGNAEGVGDAIEEGEQCRDVHGLCNLRFLPARRPEFLNILGGGAVSGMGNEFHVFHEDALRFRKARLVQLALQNRCYALIGCSLNPQEVSMAIQSIRAPVQVGDIARDHFFVPAREVSLGKVNGVGESDYLAQEIRTHAETLDDAGYLLPPRAGAPEIVGCGGLARGFGILGDPDLRSR